MKLLTYNVLQGADDRLERIARTLAEQNADIVCLQEANTFDSENDKKAKHIRDAINLPFYALAQGTKTRSGNQYHVITFSRFPFLMIRPLDGFHHAALHTVVDSDSGELSIMNAHLNPHNEAKRILETQRIVDAQKQYSAALIIGDMNSLSEDDQYPLDIAERFNDYLRANFTKDGVLCTDAMRVLKQAGYVDSAVRLGKNIPTFPTPLSKHHGDGLTFRLDYAFVSPDLESRLHHASKIDSDASDHYPFLLELK